MAHFSQFKQNFGKFCTFFVSKENWCGGDCGTGGGGGCKGFERKYTVNFALNWIYETFRFGLEPNFQFTMLQKCA